MLLQENAFHLLIAISTHFIFSFTVADEEVRNHKAIKHSDTKGATPWTRIGSKVSLSRPSWEDSSEYTLISTSRQREKSHKVHKRARRDIHDYDMFDDDVSTVRDNSNPRPYRYSGDWATPAPESGIDLGFTPVQTYIQVRKSNTVRHLPREDAMAEASSPDEVLNAHRLKEVLRTKKIQEVYSEEGYEDTAYDHGEEERHAEHDETVSKHNHGQFKGRRQHSSFPDAVIAESRLNPYDSNKYHGSPSKFSKSKKETTNTKLTYEFATMNPVNWANYNGGIGKYSSGSRKYPKRDLVSQNSDIWTFPANFDDLPGLKWGSNPETPFTLPKKSTASTNAAGIRIPSVPTVGFIHSLTDAHYGGQTNTPANNHYQHTSKAISSDLINLTDAFKPVDSSKPTESLKPKQRSKTRERFKPTESFKEVPNSKALEKENFAAFEPKKIRKRTKRNSETTRYENMLSEELTNLKYDILGKAIDPDLVRQLKPNGPTKIILKQSNRPRDSEKHKPIFDSEKYPNYYRTDIDSHSPLRYASHSNAFPIKSGKRMEFYERRDREMDCDQIDYRLDSASKFNSPSVQKDPPGKKKRIVELGDKIKCMKNKYFDEDPLDSPFFKEDEIKVRSDYKPNIKYHSTYQYHPNRTLDVYIAAKSKLGDSSSSSSNDIVNYRTIHPEPNVENTTSEDFRIIPVREAEPTTAAPIMGMRPPPMRYPHTPFSILRLPVVEAKHKPKKIRKKIHYKYNCLQPVTRMTVSTLSERSDEVIYDCSDIMLIQKNIEGNQHFQIFPKVKRSDPMSTLMQDMDNESRAGEVIESRRKRSVSNLNERRKSSLFPNKTYLDKIIKRPPFIKKDASQSNISTPATTTKSAEKQIRPTTTSSTTTQKPSELIVITPTTTTSLNPKKTVAKNLKRLSGRDFLDRYYKVKRTNALPNNDPSAFWKVQKSIEGGAIQTGSHKIKRHDLSVQQGPGISRRTDTLPTLLYIFDNKVGRGKWVAQHSNGYTRSLEGV